MKDSNNLVGYNSWSGTDYAENTSEIYVAGNTNIISSNEYSNMGESSLKIIANDISNWPCVDLFIITNPGKSVVGTFHIYNPNCDVFADLRVAQTVIVSISIPRSSFPKEVSLNGDVSSSTGTISIRLYPRNINSPIYIDDVNLS
ncbi:hypothetical protein [uncultured Methanobrevibacter sp.]|uniref:hypothetical protein n=1 Tax=uncultured Methanobrevibacter sp. TaxID=253161 RepID=UPI0025EFBF6E|nr:hypothetical protein [uncultured Methanobrevibacter sp.]